MDLRKLMKGLGFLSNARETLIRAGVSAQDLQGIDFSNPASLSTLAAKVMPEVLRKNPQIAKQIKESSWLDGKQKEDVVEIVDNI